MRRKVLLVAVTLGAATFASATSSPAVACSIAPAEPIAEVIAAGEASWGAPIVGVYEQRHIATAPGLVFWGRRSVSVVTRYWGEAPSLAPRVHGGDGLFGSSCGNSPGRLDQLDYGHISEAGGRRAGFSTLNISTGETARAKLSAKHQTLLADALGPAVSREPSGLDRAKAHLMLWWQPLVTLLITGAAVVGIRKRIRTVRTGAVTNLNRPLWWLSVFGTVAVAWLVPSFNLTDWVGLIAALAIAAGVAFLSSSLVALLALVVALRSILEDVARDFTVSGAGDGRLQAGLACLLIGAGALVFAGRSWSRWPASVSLVIGSGLFTSNLLAQRGVTGAVWVVAGTVVAMVATAVVVSQLAFTDGTVVAEAPAAAAATVES